MELKLMESKRKFANLYNKILHFSVTKFSNFNIIKEIEIPMIHRQTFF